MLPTPTVCCGAFQRRNPRGFSLVEILVVLAIIATLAVIAFGIFQGVRERAAVAHARSDLVALRQALEQYHRQYGDYPQTADTPDKLYQALTGRLGPTGVALHGRNLLPDVPVKLQNPAHPEAANNAFVDPWGNAYQYVFFTRESGTAPLRRGYVLYSFGQRKSTEPFPARAEVVPRTSGAQGGVVSESAVNAQNIYADQ